MNIEFNSPQGQIKEWILHFMRDQLLKLYHLDVSMSKAQVYFKEQANETANNKVCEIEVTNNDNVLFIHAASNSFEQAARDILNELTKRTEEKLSHRPVLRISR